MTVPKLTKEQAAIIGVYSGISCGPFSDIHELAEKLLNRPIFTHEMAFPEIWDQLREKVKPQFLEICHESEL